MGLQIASGARCEAMSALSDGKIPGLEGYPGSLTLFFLVDWALCISGFFF